MFEPRRFARLLRCTAICAGVLAVTLSGPSVTAQESSDDKDDFESLFDGESLHGWEGNPDFWSVQDGALTGQTTAENPTDGNTFLIYRERELGDFELRLKFRIVGGNSGIQYRSVDQGNFVVGGYQADIDSGTRFIGILYEERGRGILAQRGQELTIHEDGTAEVTGKTCDEEALLDSIAQEGWNDYRIVARGNRLIQSINGHVTVDVTDLQADRARAEGILALQLHAGPPMLVQFKEIRCKMLR